MMYTPAQQRPTALDVAKYLIKLAHDEENELISKASEDPMQDEIRCDMTNLKLQKILYFAQGAFLGINDIPLFDDEIEAWGLGPVIPAVYHQFKDHGRNTIGAELGDNSGIDDQYLQAFLKEIWKEFGKFSATQLVDMTHQHAPWRIAVDNGEKIISKEDMRIFYRKVYQPSDAEPVSA